MKYAPRKVYIKESGGYVELSYTDFCRRRQADKGYMDKLFIPVQGCLLEVVREQYADFYRDRERWRYLQKLDARNSLLSLDGFTDSEGNPLDFIADEAADIAETVVNVILTVQMSPAVTGEASTQISLEIAGTYSSESQTIYCPFSCVAAAQTKLDGKITGDSLSATVRDNHELDEFRQILMRHFANVDPSGHQEEINNSPVLRYQQFAVTVHDETLRETLNALNRNLQTLYRLKPIFACIEVMIGAAAGFFYIHIRRREFAIARSLGTKRIETVIMVFVEICLMFLVGAAIGTILILFVQETATQYAMAAALFFAMNVGAITACLMATGKSGIRLLREVE